MTAFGKPMPVDNELSRPYWEAARQGRLVLQRCAHCGKVRHYPRLLCDKCHSREVEWIPASGLGHIQSWTVCHHVFHPGFAEDVPYTLVTVDLDEGVRAMGRWAGARLAIGAPVRGHFDVTGDRAELIFSPSSD